MSTPSYISTNQDELFDQSPAEIQNLIQGDEVNNATVVLGKIYKLPISSYVALENIISFVLIGALKPEDVPRALVDILHLSQEDAMKMAQDLDTSILEKARIKIFGKAPTDMVELTFQEGRSEEDLRKEILDTTKRESALTKERTSTQAPQPAQPPLATVPVLENIPAESPQIPLKEKSILTAPGSRSQLLEQLQVLDDIPDDEEIATRLSKIQEQISSMDKGRTDPADTPTVPLENYLLGENADKLVQPEAKEATYSKAPTRYNVDPYREAVEE